MQKSIATKGLHYILDPARWRRFSTTLHGRFATDKSFGTKFLYMYSIDRTMQVFFDRMSSVEATGHDDGDELGTLLLNKARALMSTVEFGESMAVELPAHLAQGGGIGPKTSPQKAAKKSKVPAPSASGRTAKAGGSYHHPSEDHINPHPHPSWLVSSGVDYLTLFPNRSPKSKSWPKLLDERLPQRNKQTRSAPVCVRWQMTGKCIHGCSLAHILAKHMSTGEFQQTDRTIKEAMAGTENTT